ncbi:hypothetical protein MMPV_005640 [Pyropia vietnamensis]
MACVATAWATPPPRRWAAAPFTVTRSRAVCLAAPMVGAAAASAPAGVVAARAEGGGGPLRATGAKWRTRRRALYPWEGGGGPRLSRLGEGASLWKSRYTPAPGLSPPEPPTRAVMVAALPALVGAAAAAAGRTVAAAAPTLTSAALVSLVIIVHEAGHYIAARALGIRVLAFSLGFGPKIASWTFRGGKTEFELHAIPMGGYVVFPGVYEEAVDPASLDTPPAPVAPVAAVTPVAAATTATATCIQPDDPDLLQNRSVSHQALVFSAGVFANIALAYGAVVASVFGGGLPTAHPLPGVVVSSLVNDRCAGATAGVRPGDIIVAVDGAAVSARMDSAAMLAASIRSGRGAPLRLDLLRQQAAPSRVATGGGAAAASGPSTGRAAPSGPSPSLPPQRLRLTVTPVVNTASGEAVLGVRLSPNVVLRRVRSPIGRVGLAVANDEFCRLAVETAKGLFPRRSAWSTTTVSGPVGLVSIGADLARTDKVALLVFCAIINLHMAFLNSLPLPGLDGGHLTFLAIEAARGRPVDRRVRDGVNRTALMLVLLLSTAVLVADLNRLRLFSALHRLWR